MGGAALSPLQLFGLRQHSPGASRVYTRVNVKLQEGLWQGEPSQLAAANAAMPVVSPCWPTYPQEAFQCWQVVLVQFPVGSLLLSSDFVCALQEGSLCIPQSCGSPIPKSCWTSSPDFLGIPSPFVRSPGWEAWCGIQNLHNSGRTPLVLLFSSLWVTQPVGMGFEFYHDGSPPTISLWLLLHLWMWGIFFW